MTDTSYGTEPVKKPTWTRCKGPEGKGNGCQQRIFNTPVDIEQHRRHCPADLERDISSLERDLDALGRRYDDLERRLVDVESTDVPDQLDLDDIADDWPGTTPTTSAGDTDDEDQRPANFAPDEDYFTADDNPTSPQSSPGSVDPSTGLYSPGPLA